jgi:multiple antibiotic resistance protein
MISDLLQFAGLSFISLFVIVEPIGLIPSYLAMTANNTQEERIRMARTASITSFGTLVFFLILGHWIFDVLSVSLEAFQIAGGIVLMIIALDMLQARRPGIKETKEEELEGVDKEDIAITPLAIPLIAGPGSITTVVLLGYKATTAWHYGLLIFDLFVVCLLCYFILRYAAAASQKLSIIALKIMTRLMGLLLAAIAVQFMIDGIQTATQLW